MSKKIFLMFLFVVMTFHPGMAQEGKSLTIVYTNDVIGEIEPCG